MLLYSIFQLLIISSLSKLLIIQNQWFSSYYNIKYLLAYGFLFSNLFTILGRLVGNKIHKYICLRSILSITCLFYPLAVLGFVSQNKWGYLIGRLLHGFIGGILSYGSLIIAKSSQNKMGWSYRSVLLSVIPSLTPLFLLVFNFTQLIIIFSVLSFALSVGIYFYLPKDLLRINYSFTVNKKDSIKAIVMGFLFAIYIKQIVFIQNQIGTIASKTVVYITMSILFILMGIITLVLKKTKKKLAKSNCFSNIEYVALGIIPLLSLFFKSCINTKVLFVQFIIVFFVGFANIINYLNKFIGESDNYFMFMSIRLFISSGFLLLFKTISLSQLGYGSLILIQSGILFSCVLLSKL